MKQKNLKILYITGLFFKEKNIERKKYREENLKEEEIKKLQELNINLNT